MLRTNPPAPADAAAMLATARRVLRLEGEALLAFAEALDDAFAAAVETILAAEGRVIVSGMGKSGHVGRKIAATLASTGTPAFFVHPAEASHGDLGMITRSDVALVLSNSGETPELRDVVQHTRRFGVPLIGVASRPDSTLLKAADVALALPQAPEACPVGLAPTTSTTLTIALGDALAVALMERRRFTPEHFRVFHPGGKLGAMLVTVRDIMHAGPATPLVGLETPMRETLLVMTARGFGIAGVVDDAGRLVGVVTDGDLRRHMDGLMEHRAGEVATRDPLTVRPDALASEALAIMNGPRPATCLFVAEDGEGPQPPLGVVHVHDCLRAGLS
ncbi:MAG: KpsF/GutQ family sugar-phosphate isomerase [Rhodobacteraceae bacterium]|nr:MAG: KpsF/GutQ family sugar-phosphate isomerase [Paracoccaceae bacterium]